MLPTSRMSKLKKPISPKQLAANRANATHSTGPVTPEGKNRSAQNALKHGFNAAKYCVIRVEDPQELAQLRADYIRLYQPANTLELIALENMALAQYAMNRYRALDAGFGTECFSQLLDKEEVLLNAQLIADIPISRGQSRNFFFAAAFQRGVKNSNASQLILRHLVHNERLYRRAVEDFERLKALRKEIPNEPILVPEPEEIQQVDDIMLPHQPNPPEPAGPAEDETYPPNWPLRPQKPEAKPETEPDR